MADRHRLKEATLGTRQSDGASERASPSFSRAAAEALARLPIRDYKGFHSFMKTHAKEVNQALAQELITRASRATSKDEYARYMFYATVLIEVDRAGSKWSDFVTGLEQGSSRAEEKFNTLFDKLRAGQPFQKPPDASLTYTSPRNPMTRERNPGDRHAEQPDDRGQRPGPNRYSSRGTQNERSQTPITRDTVKGVGYNTGADSRGAALDARTGDRTRHGMREDARSRHDDEQPAYSTREDSQGTVPDARIVDRTRRETREVVQSSYEDEEAAYNPREDPGGAVPDTRSLDRTRQGVRETIIPRHKDRSAAFNKEDGTDKHRNHHKSRRDSHNSSEDQGHNPRNSEETFDPRRERDSSDARRTIGDQVFLSAEGIHQHVLVTWAKRNFGDHVTVRGATKNKQAGYLLSITEAPSPSLLKDLRERSRRRLEADSPNPLRHTSEAGQGQAPSQLNYTHDTPLPDPRHAGTDSATDRSAQVPRYIPGQEVTIPVRPQFQPREKARVQGHQSPPASKLDILTNVKISSPHFDGTLHTAEAQLDYGCVGKPDNLISRKCYEMLAGSHSLDDEKIIEITYIDGNTRRGVPIILNLEWADGHADSLRFVVDVDNHQFTLLLGKSTIQKYNLFRSDAWGERDLHAHPVAVRSVHVRDKSDRTNTPPPQGPKIRGERPKPGVVSKRPVEKHR